MEAQAPSSTSAIKKAKGPGRKSASRKERKDREPEGPREVQSGEGDQDLDLVYTVGAPESEGKPGKRGGEAGGRVSLKWAQESSRGAAAKDEGSGTEKINSGILNLET